MVGFNGFHVGKYTVRPMDAPWAGHRQLGQIMDTNMIYDPPSGQDFITKKVVVLYVFICFDML